MNPLSILSKKLFSSMEETGNPVKSAWNRLYKLPGGPKVFSRVIGMMAPYSGTIGAEVLDLGLGYSEIQLRDHRGVRNHLRSVHAIALINLAELSGNLALAYSLPDDARFIVAGLSIDYLKKARGTITARCQCPIPTSNVRRELIIEVPMHDAAGDEVARATLRTLVGPKRSANS